MQKLKHISLYLFLLFLPTQLGKHFFPDYTFINGVRIDYLSPTLFFTDIIAFLILIIHLDVLKKIFSNRRGLMLIALALISVALSMVWQVALYKWAKILVVVVLYHIYKSAKLNHKIVLGILAFSGLVELILCLLQLSHGQAMEGLWYWLGERYYHTGSTNVAAASLGIKFFIRPYGTFSHPNSLAGFYLLTYVFVYFLPDFRRYRLLKSLTMIISTMLIFISFSKTAIITYALINAISIFGNRKKIDCTLCIVTRFTVLALLALVVLMSHGDTASAEKRLSLINNSVSIIVNHPLTGVGLGNYLYAQADFPNKYPYFFLQPVHNILLLIFAETGIFVGGYLLYLLYKTFGRYIRNGLLYNLSLALLLTGMLDHYWPTLQQNIFILPVVFGLAIAQMKKPSSVPFIETNHQVNYNT